MILPLSLVAAPLAAQAQSSSDISTYRAAFKAADRGKWADAHKLAERGHDALADKVLTWMDLSRSDTDASFQELTDFIDGNPDWPGLAALRRNAEIRMPNFGDTPTRDWFDRHPPLTTAGFMRYADSLLNLGDSEKAIGLIRDRYIKGNFGVVDERTFRTKYVAILRPADHWARLDRLLWENDEEDARRMLPIVDPGHQAVALARLAMADLDPGVERLLQQVPAPLMSEPGITYERLRWRRRKEMDAGALEIVENLPKDTGPKDTGRDLGHPEAWWTERHILARHLMDQGQMQRAYRLAANHGVTDGLGFIQAEFLAGWLSLQFLNKPEQALDHFTRLYEGVSSPVGQSRGAYWAGRACEKLGNPERARQWYELGARYGSTFYGMMAQEKLGQAEAIPIAPTPSADARAKFEKNELVRAARLLDKTLAEDDDRVDLFLRKLSQDAKTPDDFVLVAKAALEMHRRDLGVGISRLSLNKGIVLADAGYPIVSSRLPAQPEPALIHALIRQESSFKVDAASGAGALGLMQLMPPTAQQLAKREGMKYTVAKLTHDPDFNIRVGSVFVQDLLDRFGGSYILAIAAYNAGPGRVANWLRDYGDPRIEAVDPVDWIETLPFYETRNYVQRVLENLHVYRIRMGGRQLPMTTDLKRGTAG
ncbi:lytic transglycosylase domain-containing protein [Nitrospirillum sp. BR 11163]|uniref:lytic transglycosylase domain-containing protein n=1 Tax=Nitrospirillum sp. BR 11163 TaxID=3104323 RepID=UPI002AFDD015|nr:lytic transglycosylase domain-containing protein [Nitrospirillum sp. BR 11163]MEA1676263.1 lytic transglycosylase domain-containing protein [Nitrospirillum sp. BR 11163]